VVTSRINSSNDAQRLENASKITNHPEEYLLELYNSWLL